MTRPASSGARIERLEARRLLAGLSAQYFDRVDFTDFKLERTDATVDFNWPAAPVAGVGADAFAVRWTGQVSSRARASSEATGSTEAQCSWGWKAGEFKKRKRAPSSGSRTREKRARTGKKGRGFWYTWSGPVAYATGQEERSGTGETTYLTPRTRKAVLSGSATSMQEVCTVAPFWDDLDLEDNAGTLSLWRATDRTIISWDNNAIWLNTSVLNFQVHLVDTGVIEFHYGAMTGSDAARISGSSATVWLESPDGTVVVPYSINTANSVLPNTGIRFTPR